MQGLSEGRAVPLPGQTPLPDNETGPTDVLIALYTLLAKAKSGALKRARPRELYTCLLPAILTPEHTLELNPRGIPPYITREVLEPGPARARVTLATAEHYDNVLTRWQPRWRNASTLKEVLELTHVFFQEVCPADAWQEILKDPNLEWRSEEAVLIQSSTRSGVSAAILGVLDDLLESESCSGALSSLIPKTEERTRRLLWTPAQAHRALHQHLGHMSSAYALSSSQRQALGHFLYGEDQVFAINGPPGTGKTTLIQDVVASLLVQHALESKPPPIIVVSSTNNQAVTNVLDSMSEVGGVHLVPGLSTFGVYLPSGSRAQEGQEKYLTAIPQRNSAPYAFNGPTELGGQVFAQLFSGAPGGSSTQHGFLERVQAHHQLPGNIDIDDVISWSQAEMKRLVHCMKLGLETYLAQKEGRSRVQLHKARKWWERALKLLGLFGQRTMLAEEEFIDAMVSRGNDPSQIRGERLNQWEFQGDTDLTSPQNWLDINLRHRLFELAVCYYEARFFEEQQRRGQLALQHNKQTPNDLLAWWHHVAMLAPVFVTTMYSGPRFFQADNKERLFEGIDLLIVDEAGQVAPEVCVGMMALAKRALVVGDSQQLEPVWSIPKSVDWANIEGFRLSSFHHPSSLESTGAMASNGSVMRMAQQASSVEVPNFAPGALLREHRRCPKQIITFCNDLAYKGLIRPMKSDNPDGLLPHLGYAHVKGRMERYKGSNQNKEEAYAIAEWLHRRTPELLKHYKTSRLQDIVAVVTPFRAQAELIRNKMTDFSRALGECTVGTVHSLQGAERPIVLFSTVYTTFSASKKYFFDAGVSMLNVAASRAKDSFVVFGDIEIFREFGKQPSNILARHLLGANGVEIQDVQFREVPVKKYLLSDLQRHREALKWAIGRATHELHIASPWMTLSALKEDNLPALFQRRFDEVGLDIHLYVDAAKIKDIKTIKQAQSMLGDDVHLHDCDRLHSKLVICDRNTYIMGSFNWLSSVRRRGSDEYKFYETSIIQTQKILDNVEDWCVTLTDDLQERVVSPARWSTNQVQTKVTT